MNALELIKSVYQQGERTIRVPLYVYEEYRDGLTSIARLVKGGAARTAETPYPPLVFKDAFVEVA